MTQVTVYKRNHLGEAVWEYDGELVARGDTWMCIEAYFMREDFETEYVTYRKGDRFTEWYYSDRWYNIFRLEDVETKQLKGWYCNLVRPAEFTENTIAGDDLALDVFILPDGEMIILDEDEFDELALSAEDQAQVWAAVDALRGLVARRESPFDEIR